MLNTRKYLGIFFLACTICSSAVAEQLQGSEIISIPGQGFALTYFNHHPKMLDYLESKNLQGGGYTWEALAKAAIGELAPEIGTQIDYDPESDYLFALSADREVLKVLENLLQRLSTDLPLRERCVQIAIEAGYLE